MGAFGAACLAVLAGFGPGPTGLDDSPDGIVVVELFTSEGCSSCPAADRNLTRLIEAERKAGRDVLALGFHVDYWNQLGHPDRFSDARFTERQRMYSGRLSEGSLYTPEMIVNGTQAFVGSEQTTTDQAVTLARKERAVAILKAEAKDVGDAMQVTCQLPEAARGEGVRVFAAWVTDGLRTEVTRGENAGRTLTHDAVVRSWASARPDASGHASLTITRPPTVDASATTHDSLVLLVQTEHASLGRIVAAGRLNIPEIQGLKPHTATAPSPEK